MSGTPEEFFWGIDYALLREQKEQLLKVIDDLAQWGEGEAAVAQSEALDGILSLIDSLQDLANDDLKIPNVFAFEGLSRDAARGFIAESTREETP